MVHSIPLPVFVFIFVAYFIMYYWKFINDTHGSLFLNGLLVCAGCSFVSVFNWCISLKKLAYINHVNILYYRTGTCEILCNNKKTKL